MAKLLLLSGFFVLTLLLGSKAAVFFVGDTAGWDTSADLTSWPAAKIFTVGDILSFQYSNYHTVNEVDKNGYDNCNISNALLRRSGGNTTVTLTTPGDKYFICSSVPHCFGGMRLKVNVRSNQTAPSPATAAALSPADTLTPSSSTTVNGDFFPTEFSGMDQGGRSRALFMATCFNFGAFWWLFMMKF